MAFAFVSQHTEAFLNTLIPIYTPNSSCLKSNGYTFWGISLKAKARVVNVTYMKGALIPQLVSSLALAAGLKPVRSPFAPYNLPCPGQNKRRVSTAQSEDRY